MNSIPDFSGARYIQTLFFQADVVARATKSTLWKPGRLDAFFVQPALYTFGSLGYWRRSYMVVKQPDALVASTGFTLGHLVILQDKMGLTAPKK